MSSLNRLQNATVEIVNGEGVVVSVTEGSAEIDFADASVEEIKRLVQGEDCSPPISIELGNCVALTSTDVGELLKIRKAFPGSKLTLSNVNPSVMQYISALKLHKVFTICPSGQTSPDTQTA